jgi:cyclohexanone monooxygenase
MPTSPQTQTATAEEPTLTIDAVVVGAGFGGLYMLYKLREIGVSAKAFEAGADLGGTWYWNRYPGARCDVESLEYSYSFSKELEQEWDWEEKYATQPEILRYANHVADRFDLRRDIQFSTKVLSAVYDDTANRWLVTTDQGDRVSAQFLVMATGCLSFPKMPEVPGLESYEGPWYHTGRWPHEGVDLTGKKVAVIGTGSSGIQSIPIFAEQAADLTVFQRTPNFSFPAGNAPLSAEVKDAMKAIYPDHRQEARESGFGIPVEMPELSALEVSAEDRQVLYEERWDRGNLVAMLLAYNDLITSKEANDTAAEFIRSKIRDVVADPEIAELLCPKDHPVGTKRPCLDTNYYETYNRDNVHLVDLRSTPIVEITPKGVRTTAEEYEFDTIIFATGFDAMTGALTNIDIRGTDGQSLKEKWSHGPRTYLGIGTAGFPNMFTITGPQSPSVLSNMMLSIEQHVDWVGDCIAYLRSHDLAAIDATVEAEEAWVEHTREVGETTLYPLANSWYMGSNVAGKVRVFMPYIGGVGVYRERCDEVAAKDYEGFALIS